MDHRLPEMHDCPFADVLDAPETSTDNKYGHRHHGGSGVEEPEPLDLSDRYPDRDDKPTKPTQPTKSKTDGGKEDTVDRSLKPDAETADEKIQRMNRRTVVGLAIAVLGGGAILSRTDSNLSVGGSDIGATNASDGPTDTPTPQYPITESLGGPFKRIRYFEDGTAEIEFDDFNEIDGWALMYHQYDNLDNALHICKVPDSGSVRINLIELLQNQNTVYPDRKFNLIALTGAFDACSYQNRYNVITDRTHVATIHIPSEFTIASTPTPTDTPESTPTPDDGNTTVGFD